MSWNIYHGDCREVMQTLHPESVDSIVSDPPYGLSFMGKGWDHGVPGEEFWTEALRVAKPGAHLLAFGGTRTYHRLACAIEDAGWEIRDCVMWVYGSGFPKSHDVSKAIDKMDASEEQERRRLRFTAWVRSTGVTSRQIDEATGTNMGGHYTTAASQPAVMTREHLESCRHLLGDVPEWVEREADIRSVESRNMAEREVVGKSENGQGRGWAEAGLAGYKAEFNITAPATDAAKQWGGWGTALKPAWEPIIVARKPLCGTVAENVLMHGTGGINVDGCRVGIEGPSGVWGAKQLASLGYHGGTKGSEYATQQHPSGRWPANVIHDGSDEVVGLFPDAPSAGRYTKSLEKPEVPNNGSIFRFGDTCRRSNSYAADSGSAARFFYCAKASKADRDEGCEGLELVTHQSGMGGAMPVDDDGNARDRFKAQSRNHHPTVKPTALMRYLCRLVTPPGGVVLDPFTGSGSTGKAAILEGFRFIGIEREAEYVEIAKARIGAAEPGAGTLFAP
jgi:DNA modification methylase